MNIENLRRVRKSEFSVYPNHERSQLVGITDAQLWLKINAVDNVKWIITDNMGADGGRRRVVRVRHENVCWQTQQHWYNTTFKHFRNKLECPSLPIAHKRRTSVETDITEHNKLLCSKRENK